jgi:hypothetical protein
MEIKIKQRVGKSNQFDVTMKNLTAGMILALKNALENYPSPVATDVKDFLNAAIDETPGLKERIN